MAEMSLGDVTIAYEVAGAGPPVLLLHGFPQTRALWARVAPVLAERFTVVAADLRGYGASSKPEAAPDLSNYSFRAMAGDMRALMATLGFTRFHLVGHDRGARVAHRLALDVPDAVASLTVMDIVPTLHLLETFALPVARAYWHWAFLAQPAPFPERTIAQDPDSFFETCLAGWGGAGLADFDPDALAAYRAAWRTPDTIAGMCNDYRAALEVDRAHDEADRGQTVDCPALVLYGADGVMARLYDVPATWADRLSDMRAEAIPGGHFFIDEAPEATVAALMTFLTSVEDA